MPNDTALSRRQLLAAGATGAGALAFAACGGSTTKKAAQRVGRPAKKPSELIVRTWGDPWKKAYTEGPAKAFTAETGIPVRFDLTDYSQMQAKVQQSVRAGQRPPVDLVLTIEDDAYAAAVRGLSVPLDPSVVSNFRRLNPVGRPSDGSTNYVKPYTYTQPLFYVKARAPLGKDISWEEIFTPKYRKKVFLLAVAPPLLYPVAKMLGLDVAKDDLTPAFKKIATIKPNVAATGDDEEFIAGVERGQFDVGIALVADALGNPKVGWVVPREGARLTAEAFYVPKQLPDNVTYYAQVFIDKALEATTLSGLGRALAEVPTNPRSQLPSYMRGDPAFPFTQADIAKYALVVPPEVAVKHQDQWNAAYSAAIGA